MQEGKHLNKSLANGHFVLIDRLVIDEAKGGDLEGACQASSQVNRSIRESYVSSTGKGVSLQATVSWNTEGGRIS